MKKQAVMVLIIFLLLSPFVNIHRINGEITTTKQNNTHFNSVPLIRVQNITINLNFIGFDEEVIDEEELLKYLPDTSEFFINPYDPHSILHFQYNITYFSEQDAETIENLILTEGVNGTGTGYMINTTLLQEDLTTGERSDIFIPVDGIALNVDVMHDYIYNTYYKQIEDIPAYSLYLLNMSRLDNSQRGLDHYYTKEIINFDTNRTVNYWYSGYNNIPPLQPLGWGGKYRFAFIDLSARTWYFDWVKTAWTKLPDTNTETLYFKYADLDSLSEDYNFYTSGGRHKLVIYLYHWINSYVGNVFSAYYYSNPIGESYSLQVIVFDNLTNSGYSFSDINWVISKARIESVLIKSFPWIDWDVNITFTPLNEHHQIANYIEDNLKVDQYGYYLETGEGFLTLLENLLPTYFNLSAADTVLPCYAFLLNNISFTIYGIRFAGLGGMGWELLVSDQYLLFEDGDPTKPRRGMSATMIHELGHSLGFPHPHSITYSWGSEFIDEVMSYFPLGTSNFSRFYIDGLGRAHGDHFIYQAKLAYEDAYNKYIELGSPTKYSSAISEIKDTLSKSEDAYYRWDYNSSIVLAIKAKRDANALYIEMTGGETETTQTTTDTNINESGFWAKYGWIIGVGIAVLLLPSVFLTIRIAIRRR